MSMPSPDTSPRADADAAGDCPSDERLRASLAAGEGRAADLTRHLEICERCRRRLETLAGGRDLLEHLSERPEETQRIRASGSEPELLRILDDARRQKAGGEKTNPGQSP